MPECSRLIQNYFVLRLLPHIGNQVRLLKPQCLKDAVTLAQEFEIEANRRSERLCAINKWKVYTLVTKSSTTIWSSSCYGCKQVGHTYHNCRHLTPMQKEIIEGEHRELYRKAREISPHLKPNSSDFRTSVSLYSCWYSWKQIEKKLMWRTVNLI